MRRTPNKPTTQHATAMPELEDIIANTLHCQVTKLDQTLLLLNKLGVFASLFGEIPGVPEYRIEGSNLFNGERLVSKLRIPSPKIDWDAIHARVSLLDLLNLDGVKVAKRKCLCPFHTETTPSFSLVNDGRGGSCFGCGWQGDAITYWQQTRGFANRFEAAIDLQEDFGTAPVQTFKASAEQEELDPVQFADLKKRLLSFPLEDLKDDCVLSQLLTKKKIPKGVAALINSDGHLGTHEGKPCYIYDSGIKIRHEADSSRSTRWLCGKPSESLWRGDLLNDPVISNVFICEGETDAMRCIPLLEDGTSIVVCCPSASWSPGQETLFRIGAQRKVITLFDKDEAGGRLTDRIHEGLSLIEGCDTYSFNWDGMNGKDMCDLSDSEIIDGLDHIQGIDWRH